MKSRLGKKDSIFTKTAAPAKETKLATVRVAGPTGSSVDNKLTVILQPDQVEYLDRLRLDIRAKTKAKISRTEIIRALVVALMASDIDLTACQGEEDIAVAIQERMAG